jgi:hypothetical protein
MDNNQLNAALFCLFHIALLLNAPCIIQPFPAQSNRVLALLDNRRNRSAGYLFLPKKKKIYMFSVGK